MSGYFERRTNKNKQFAVRSRLPSSIFQRAVFVRLPCTLMWHLITDIVSVLHYLAFNRLRAVCTILPRTSLILTKIGAIFSIHPELGVIRKKLLSTRHSSVRTNYRLRFSVCVETQSKWLRLCDGNWDLFRVNSNTNPRLEIYKRKILSLRESWQYRIVTQLSGCCHWELKWSCWELLSSLQAQHQLSLHKGF